MKKLKTIFSPRKLVIWLSILIFIFAAPQINGSALSETDAIVTMVFVDKVDKNIKVSASVLTPAEGKKKNQIIFSGVGATFDNAVENMSIAMGKDMGFAQCQIMGFGDNICKDGIMAALDYMTRTKKVGRNAILISFDGDVAEFAQAISDLNTNSNLSLNEIISFDNRYTMSQDSNVESFYIGYFSDLSLGITPHLSFGKEEKDNAIEVSGSNSSDGGGLGSSNATGGSPAGEEKKYLLNDGSISVFKKGKKQLKVEPEMIKKLSLYVNNNQKGTILVEGVTDKLYDNATVVTNIIKKDTKFETSFKDGKPMYKAKIALTVMVEQVDDNTPQRTMLRRNQEFLTPALVEKLKEKTKQDVSDAIDFCKENSVDLINVYKNFYRKQYKDWKKFMETTDTESYLEDIDFSVDVEVASEF